MMLLAVYLEVSNDLFYLRQDGSLCILQWLMTRFGGG